MDVGADLEEIEDSGEDLDVNGLSVLHETRSQPQHKEEVEGGDGWYDEGMVVKEEAVVARVSLHALQDPVHGEASHVQVTRQATRRGDCRRSF